MSSLTERSLLKSWRFRLASTAAAAPLLMAANCHTNTSHTTEQENTPIPTSSHNPDITPSPQSKIETPISKPTVTPESTKSKTDSKRNIATNEDGLLVITEPGYTYTINPNVTLNDLLGKPGSKSAGILDYFAQRNMPQNILDDIRSNLNKAEQIEAENPNDPRLVQFAMIAANKFNNVCDPNVLLEKPYMAELASYVYKKGEGGWDDNKGLFLGSKCYWGATTAISTTKHEVVKLDNNLYIYSNVTLDDLLDEKNIAPLRASLKNPQSLDSLVLNYIRGAKKYYDINPMDPAIGNALFPAEDNLVEACKYNPQATEYMRLIASFVHEKYPPNWNHILYYDLIPCGMATDPQNN